MIQTGYVFPLSYTQQTLWFLDQLQPGNPVYNVPLCLKLTGSLNIPALQKSVNRLIERHEILRTNFVTQAGQPFQLVHPSRALELGVKDLSALSESVRQHQADQLVEQEALLPFDLSSDLLLRAGLLKLGSDSYLLLLTFHHIITDGWSMGIFTNELSQCYQAECAGLEPALPELPIQYADYALWQRERLQGETLEQMLSYWRQHMAGAPQVLELPTDFARPAVMSYRGAHYKLELGLELARKLKQFNQQAGVTNFMTLLTAFKLLLSRYSGQEDIVIGTPIANRTQPETAGLLGFFSNTVVMRTDLSGNPSFSQLLKRVSKTALGAYANQELPFDQLVDELRPQRELSHAPLFQYQFTLQKAAGAGLELGDLEIEMLDSESGTAKWDLTLMLNEGDNGELFGFIEYNTDLFKEATIARLATCWRTLLESVIENPELPVGNLNLLDAAHRQQLQAWRSSGEKSHATQGLHQLFEAQVLQNPQATALEFQGQCLTYAELNQRANQLAHYLGQLGVGPEVPVGICVKRSFEMIIGLLGVLKAGGGYVPLDPAYPHERLAYMLENSNVPVLLTQEALLDQLPSSWAQTFCLDSDVALLADYPTENPGDASGVTPDNLAYIIYTSGSTGKPKGVLVPHRGVVQVVEAQTKLIGIEATDRILQFASFSFDASVSELFTAFDAGACVCLNPQSSLLPGEPFSQLLQQQAITVATLSPAVLAAQANRADEVPSLRTIVSAGEACTAEIIASWSKNRRFINAYGPTEASICATMSNPLQPGDTISIGRPIPNVEIYVLDKNRQLVPIGVPGELYLGGANLTRGYLGLPELSAEKFITNPFSTEADQRLYRTGDLVRYLPDGQLEFLGRIDQQVKLRGYRIELGEIEEVLLQHPDVQNCAVIIREDQPGDKRLVAYLVAATSSPDGAVLRQFLQKRLPAYMLPSAFVELEKLPVTPNGKTDRTALPAPDQQRRQTEAYTAPQTATEKILVGLWEEVLATSPIGIQDNYFALGGDSIRVVQICHEAVKHNLSLTPQDLFQYPTVAKLAEYLAGTAGQAAQTIPLELVVLPEEILAQLPADTEDAYPASKMQLVMLENYAKIPGAYHGLQAFKVYDPGYSPEALTEALQLQTKKHPVLRTVFVQIGSAEPIQVVRRDLPAAITEIDLSFMAAAEQESFVAEIIELERARLFDLTDPDAPLVRYHLFNLADDEFQLMMTTHHAIEDGWGFAHFLNELFDYYQQLKSGVTIAPMVAVNSYKEFIALEQEIIGDPAAAQFWQEFLQGRQPVELTHRPESSQSLLQDTEIVPLDPALAGELHELATRLQVAPKAVFLSAFLETVGQLAGVSTPTVGVISNGRTERLTEPFKTPGLFWNIAPFHCPETASDNLERIKLVQQRLVAQESFARYPLSEIARGQATKELFFAVFNFIHFHNLGQLPLEDEMTLTSTHAYDKFHYPLNFVVSVNPFSKDIWFKTEYDNAYLSAEQIESFNQTFAQVLNEIARSQARRSF